MNKKKFGMLTCHSLVTPAIYKWLTCPVKIKEGKKVDKKTGFIRLFLINIWNTGSSCISLMGGVRLLKRGLEKKNKKLRSVKKKSLNNDPSKKGLIFFSKYLFQVL